MWIAKDSDGTICIFENKPIRQEKSWYIISGKYFEVPEEFASFNLKWEDEPFEVELKKY